jgi:hypothetical protein
VRNLIESLRSEELERGLSVGVYNKRGVHAREPGGNQERRLAQQFREYARRVEGKWPRTALMLDGIAQGYESEAKREDERAAFEEFE